jgi:hypothetical protein
MLRKDAEGTENAEEGEELLKKEGWDGFVAAGKINSDGVTAEISWGERDECFLPMNQRAD